MTNALIGARGQAPAEADVSLGEATAFSGGAIPDAGRPAGVSTFALPDIRLRNLLRGPEQSRLHIQPIAWRRVRPRAAHTHHEDGAYGSFVGGERSYVGIPPRSAATFGGLRVSTTDTGVSCTLVPPNTYDFLGNGANVEVTPAAGDIRLSGQNLLVTMAAGGVDVESGTIHVAPGGSSYRVESGVVRPMRDLPPPAAGAAETSAVGRTVELERIPGGRLYIDGIDIRDVNQGAVGDCWLISALNAIAAMRPDLIQRMIIDNGDHTYTVRFPGAGPVTVDDRFYHYADSLSYARSLVYVSGTDAAELWGPIVEKAYAELEGRGYQSIWGGYPDAAFRTLSGMRSQTVVNRRVSAEQLFQQIVANANARNPMVAISGTPPPSAAVSVPMDDATTRSLGLRNWHGYAVLGGRIEDGQRYVILRNTSSADVTFKTSAYSTDVDYDGDGRSDRSSGFFRMRIEDFQRYFYQTTTLPLS